MGTDANNSAKSRAKSVKRSLWRNRDYVLLWSGQGVSVLGTQVSQIVFPLLLLTLTSSPIQVGLIAGLATIPYTLLSLPAGALVDRWNRKRVMIISDTGRAVFLSSVPLMYAIHHLTLVQLCVVAIVNGTLSVFFNLANTASFPHVVSQEQLATAVAQNQVTFNASSLIGPPLGGALFQAGRAIPFLLDTVSYVISAITLLFIHTEFQAARAGQSRDLRAEIMLGLRWIWRHPTIRFMLVLQGSVVFLSSGGYLILILLAKHQHASSSTIGAIFAATALGGIPGSLLGARIQGKFGSGQVMAWTVWGIALLWPFYALAPNALCLGIVGAIDVFLFSIFSVVLSSCQMRLIPDELRGRVNSAFNLVVYGGQPLGIALTGTALQSVGLYTTVVLIAVCLVLVAGAATLNSQIRTLQAPF